MALKKRGTPGRGPRTVKHRTAVDEPRKLTPHQRIMRAAAECRGIRLSEDEVHQLAMDDAIAAVADSDDERGGKDRGGLDGE